MTDTKYTRLEQANIPEELSQLRQWVCWRFAERDGKPTKEPINPTYTGRKASTTDPTSWSTFKHALSVYEMHPLLDGIGFVFTARDPYCGIDFDNCIEGGVLDPWVEGWIDRLGGYTELSPSGTGVHVIVKAELPGGGKNNRARGVEIYDRERFFTVTGRAL